MERFDINLNYNGGQQYFEKYWDFLAKNSFDCDLGRSFRDDYIRIEYNRDYDTGLGGDEGNTGNSDDETENTIYDGSWENKDNPGSNYPKDYPCLDSIAKCLCDRIRFRDKKICNNSLDFNFCDVFFNICRSLAAFENNITSGNNHLNDEERICKNFRDRLIEYQNKR